MTTEEENKLRELAEITSSPTAFLLGFNHGQAYWQKGMYSEEKMLNIYREYQHYLITNDGVCLDMIEWFEQNKKK